ncbi:DUF2164 domain-containing protein [Candidatus Bipolaricaulota bacterium]|nr:DUF2164 domain-containing protein [Candidatus Bipolaricaulota bacterium]
MAIELIKDHRQALVLSLKQCFAEDLDQDIGDLKAPLLLDFILKEIGPVIHNRAVADAQARMQEMVAELDGSCYEPEFAYWKR